MEPLFKHELGTKVCLCTGGGESDEGIVIGQVQYLDGSVGYFVSVFSHGEGRVVRHLVIEQEMVAA